MPPSPPRQDIEWSTASVLGDTVAAAQRHGLSVAPLDTLPTLLDVDTTEDLRRWCAAQQAAAAQQQEGGGGDELLTVALRLLADAPPAPS